MRSRHFRTIGTAWRTPIEAAPAQPPQQLSALDLPGEQQFGLVYLRQAGEDSLASKVIAHMREQSIAFPSALDWRALRREGYVSLEGARHTLTPKGRGAAQAIIKRLAESYGIHHQTRTGGRGTRAGAMSYCTCGWTAGPYRLNRSVDSMIGRAELRHEAEIAAGTWKKPRPLADFLAEAQDDISDDEDDDYITMIEDAAARGELPR